MLKIPHQALVFVGDGRKALFLRNDGDAKFPNLRVEEVLESENPSTREQGSDRPGRVSQGAVAGRKAAFEPTDWHDLQEYRFARTVAVAMERMARANKATALIVVAPPRTLSELRSAIHSDVRARVIAEINKDLTKHSVEEIEKLLMAGA